MSCFLPAGVWSRFEASLSVGLPHTVGELVADRRHHLDELQRPLVQVQRANPGQVSAQISVDAWALDADQGSEVQTRPVWIWRSNIDMLNILINIKATRFILTLSSKPT